MNIHCRWSGWKEKERIKACDAATTIESICTRNTLCQDWSTMALLGQNLVERLDRAIGKADERALTVAGSALDKPWLRGPPVGNPRGGREHGRGIMDLGGLLLHSGGDGRTLPSFVVDAVRLENAQPKDFPRRTSGWRGPLRPDVPVILEIPVQSDGDAAHVGHTAHFLGFANEIVHIGRGQHDKNGHDGQSSDNVDDRECLVAMLFSPRDNWRKKAIDGAATASCLRSKFAERLSRSFRRF